MENKILNKYLSLGAILLFVFAPILFNTHLEAAPYPEDESGYNHVVDDEGWTVFNPSPDTQRIYVSSSQGQDGFFDGSSPEVPARFTIPTNNLTNVITRGYQLTRFILKNPSGEPVGYLKEESGMDWADNVIGKSVYNFATGIKIGQLSVRPWVYDYRGFNLDGRTITVANLTYTPTNGTAQTGYVLIGDQPLLVDDTVIEGCTISNAKIVHSYVTNVVANNLLIAGSEVHASNVSGTDASHPKIYASTKFFGKYNLQSGPRRSLKGGYYFMRNGYPDWLLLKKGDSWVDEIITLDKAGRSNTEMMLISGYGDSNERPKIIASVHNGGIKAGINNNNWGAPVNYLAIAGIHFINTGSTILGPSNEVVLEDCYFEAGSPGAGNVNGVTSNFTLRRCIIADNYNFEDAHNQGIFVYNVDGIMLEENIFYHNGWSDKFQALTKPVSNIAQWQSLRVGKFSITINGILYNISGLNFSSVLSMDDVARIVKNGINTSIGHNAIDVFWKGPEDKDYYWAVPAFYFKTLDHPRNYINSLAQNDTIAEGTNINFPQWLNATNDEGKSLLKRPSPTLFNHNIYIDDGPGPTVNPGNRRLIVRRNIIADGSATGLQARPGGIVNDNVFVRNPMAIVFGGGDDPAAGGTSGSISGNVIIEGNDLLADRGLNSRGRGIEIFNLSPEAETVISGNIIANRLMSNNMGNTYGIQVNAAKASTVGVHNLSINDNIIYDWYRPLQFFGTAGDQITNVSVTSNNFQIKNLPVMTERYLTRHDRSLGIGIFTYRGNIYHADPISGWDQARLFRIDDPRNGTLSFSQWLVSSGETGASYRTGDFFAPNRNLASYNGYLGKEPTYEAFIAEILRQSKFNWHPEYTARSIIRYIKEGFTETSAVPILAEFRSSLTSGIAPLIINFVDQSSGEINSRLWNFGDGVTSTERDPQHTYRNVGRYTVSLTVGGPSGSNTRTRENFIEVMGANQRPVLSGIADQRINENNLLSFNLSATDPNGDELTYSAMGLPSGAILNASSGAFSWRPTHSQGGGSYPIIFKVNDGRVDSALVTMSITVIITIPNAPKTLTASAVGPSQINLAWIDWSYNEDGFKIERARSSSGPFSQIAIAPAHTMAYSDTGLTSGVYYYRIRSYNAAGNSSYTNVALVTLGHAPEAFLQQVNTSENTAKSITLSANDPDGEALTYIIVANPTHGTLSGSGATRTYTPAVNYSGADSFTFKANDGRFDSNVATVSITVRVRVPNAPKTLTASAVGPSQINLAWIDWSYNEDGFKIERARSSSGPFSQIAIAPAHTMAYSDTGLTSGVYYYRIRSYNAAGNSSYTNVAQARLL